MAKIDKEDLIRKGMGSVVKGINYERIASIFDSSEEFSYIPLGDIIVEEQVRKSIDTESESFLGLLDSIREKGILNPLLVSQHGDKKRLISGERRYKAAEILKLPSVPVRILRGTFNKEETMSLQLIENLHRENLNPIDEAQGYFDFYRKRTGVPDISSMINDLMHYGRDKARLKKEDADTVSAIEKISGKTYKTIQRMVSLLRLPKEVREPITTGKIGATQGYILSENIGSEKFGEIYKKVLAGGFTKDTLKEEFGRKEKKPKVKSYLEQLRKIKRFLERDLHKIDSKDFPDMLAYAKEIVRLIENRIKK